MELSQHLHLLTAVVSGYLFLFFGWWWYSAGGSTHIYKITFFLMFGICFTHAGAWFIYYKNWTDPDTLQLLHTECWWWPYRQIFVLVPLVWYAVHGTKKAFRERKLW